MTRSRVRLRRATTADVGLVAPLFALYREFYEQPYDEQVAAAFLRERLERRESVVLLAEEEHSGAVGFVQLYPGFSSVSVAPAWTLGDLYVAPGSRGTGVASLLLEGAEVLAREAGATSLILETAHDNHVAQRLYERHGYRVEDHYRHYEKALS